MKHLNNYSGKAKMVFTFLRSNSKEFLRVSTVLWRAVFGHEDIESDLVLEHDDNKNYSVFRIYNRGFFEGLVAPKDSSREVNVDDLETLRRVIDGSDWFKMKVFIGVGMKTEFYKKICELITNIICQGTELDNTEKIKMLKLYITRHTRHTFVSPDEERLLGMHALLDELMETESSARLRNKKAQVIQNVWRQIVCDPGHNVCKRRLLHEFQGLTDLYVH
jgi:hypothetical protein